MIEVMFWHDACFYWASEEPMNQQTDIYDILSAAFGVAFCAALLVSFFML